jgi:transketolase
MTGAHDVRNAMNRQRIRELEAIAARVRRHILRTVHAAKGGHVGGPLSATDMLVALYFEIMKIDPARPDWEDRDRLILSKGHSCIAQYAVMAERGYFPVEELATFDSIDSRLQGHPDMTKLPGLDMSTGSLGQGLSSGVGIALGAKLRGKDFTVYVMLGDGETQEGQVWEAAFVASRYRLDNLVAALDCNKLQQFGWQDARGVQAPLDEPVRQWEAFGWRVTEVDGHDIAAFVDAVQMAKEAKDRPAIVIVHTVKGKGVSFMENDFSWHARVPTDGELERALAELGVA